MRPVLVLQNLSADSPGYLGTWLANRHLRYELFDAEAGQAYPGRIDGYGALALLGGGDPCPHQAFAIGRHLAMQFHVELDERKLATWSASQEATFLRLQREQSTVQSGAAMRAQAALALPARQRLADRVYRRWLGVE